MIKIFKYIFYGPGAVWHDVYDVPKGATLLHVGLKPGEENISVWYQVDADAMDTETRRVYAMGTGQYYTGEEGRYVGTVIMPHGDVWHYFDDRPREIVNGN